MRRLGAMLGLAILAGCTSTKPNAVDYEPPPVSPAAVIEAVPSADPVSRMGNKSPYSVFGRQYTVMPSAKGYSEEGIASWYGMKFQGRLTSNGEVFDVYKATAAHKSLPLPIGFLMHGHKNLSYCPAVILNDEVISDNPEGGTGKGIFMNALSHMKKLVTIDGKAFAFEKSFAYQLVSVDTQILCFDDVKKYFNFERLFSVVTEGLTLEKKNKDAIKIPFNKSPKIAITTNYAIKGTGNSFQRRQWELEL